MSSLTSRPARARGLKLGGDDSRLVPSPSRPARARGLKLVCGDGVLPPLKSRPARARGLKLEGPGVNFLTLCRAPRGRVD